MFDNAKRMRELANRMERSLWNLFYTCLAAGRHIPADELVRVLEWHVDHEPISWELATEAYMSAAKRGDFTWLNIPEA